MKKIAFALLFVVSYVLGDVLSVSDIDVRAEARDAYTAQQHAQQQAMVKAFIKMLDSEFAEYSINPSKISTNEILSCVYDYSIDREKLSNKVFVGKFSFRFDKNKVVNLLKNHDVIINNESQLQQADYVVSRFNFIRHNALLKRHNAIITKFNNEKIVFKMNIEDAKKISQKIKCIKL